MKTISAQELKEKILSDSELALIDLMDLCEPLDEQEVEDLLEKTKNFSSAKRMYESLPHTSSYHIPLQPSVFPALSKWNIR